MKISFILPIKNEYLFICGTLDRILNQTIINDIDLEIIIADGESTDGSIELIQQYINKYKFIKLINNKKQIVSYGFNIALNEAKGDIIIRIDGHSEIPPNYVEKCISILQNNKIDIAGGMVETIASGNIGKAIAIAQSSLFGVGGVKFRDKNYNKSTYVNTLAFGAHKRDIFYEIGGYDVEMIYNQDDEFNLRAIQAGKKIWMDSDIKTKYYSRSSFSKLFKQYFNYGCYKVRGIQKRKQLISIRHLIPATFVITLIGTLLSGYYLHQPSLSFSILSTYLLINTFSSIILSPAISLIPLVFLSFWVLHLSYGFGFLWGLIRFASKWGDTKLKDDHFNREKFIANSAITI